MTVTRTSAPVRGQVVRILQELLGNGHFAPGKRLVERELCELLGISRTTVREALRQVEAEGLVKVIPGKGVVAASISPDEAHSLYQVRQVLEGLAGRLFSENASDEMVAEVDSAYRRILEAVTLNPQDAKRILASKDQLYEVLFQGCGNAVLRAMAASVHARVTLLRSLSISRPGRLPDMVREIGEILDAIRRRDSVAAERACATHVHNAATAAIEMLRARNAESGT